MAKKFGRQATLDLSATVKKHTAPWDTDIFHPSVSRTKLNGRKIVKLQRLRFKNLKRYFLAKMDKMGIKIIKGFDYDDDDRSWIIGERV